MDPLELTAEELEVAVNEFNRHAWSVVSEYCLCGDHFPGTHEGLARLLPHKILGVMKAVKAHRAEHASPA